MAIASKPAIVLVPGAWHSPVHLQSVAEGLEKQGYSSYTVTLASVGETAVEDPIGKDASLIRQAIESFTKQGQNVIVAMHSYGGVPGSEATAEVCRAQQADPRAGEGRIIKLIYMTAMAIPQGKPAFDDLNPHVLYAVDGLFHHLEPYYRFYRETPLPLAHWAIQHLRPFTIGGLADPTKHCGWKDYNIPADYLFCEKDNALRPDHEQEIFVERLESAGVLRKVHRLEADHTPWLSAESQFWKAMDEILKHTGAL